MRKLQFVVLSLAFFVPLSQAQSQPCSVINRESCVYVSALTGNRIYRFDASTGTATVVNDGASRTVPELPGALVEGPDKLLYYADVSNCANTSTYVVRRFDPFAPLGAKGLNSTLEAVLAGGSGSICPAGLTFDVEGNLYANSQPFTGVYKIVKVQDTTQIPVSKILLGQLSGSATAVPVLPASSTNPAPGAGIIFSNSGDLFFIGPNPDQVLFKSAPPFSSAAPFVTTGLSNPIGIAQDNVGNIFVANHEARQILRCDPDTRICAEFATFTDSADQPVYPVYIDTNSEGNLFVATEQIIGGVRKNGKIWRLTDPGGTCPGSYCESAGSIPKVSGKIAPAYGIGLSATSAMRTGTFGPGPDLVFGTADDIASQIFDFGTSFFILSYPSGVLKEHTVSVKAHEVFPGDLTFLSSATSCNSYHGKKGKCVVYGLSCIEGCDSDTPTKEQEFKDEYSAYIKHSGSIPTQSAILHDSRSLAKILLAGGPDFPDNIFTRFDLGPPGVDPGTGGKTDNFTAYVSADLGPLGNALPPTPSFVTPIFPTQDCESTEITVVKRGQGLPVKISIADQFGNTVTNALVRLGVAQIIGNSLFPDEVRSTVNFENRFRVQSNVYVYNLVTDALKDGCHVLTAAPDRDSLFRFPPSIAAIKVVP